MTREWSAATCNRFEIGKTPVFAKSLENRNAQSLKRLALALMTHPHTVALLGSTDQNDARLIFARSADASGDMHALMKKACEVIEGRGGGKPDLAQGGGKNLSELSEAIEAAATAPRSSPLPGE